MTNYKLNGVQWYFVQIVSWASLFSAFVLFEETVVDRSQWKHLIPGYRPGSPCVWDLIAAVAIAVLVFCVFRQKETGTSG